MPVFFRLEWFVPPPPFPNGPGSARRVVQINDIILLTLIKLQMACLHRPASIKVANPPGGISWGLFSGCDRVHLLVSQQWRDGNIL